MTGNDRHVRYLPRCLAMVQSFKALICLPCGRANLLIDSQMSRGRSENSCRWPFVRKAIALGEAKCLT